MISSTNLDSSLRSGELWVWSAKFWWNFSFSPVFYAKVSNGADFFHGMIHYPKLTHKDHCIQLHVHHRIEFLYFRSFQLPVFKETFPLRELLLEGQGKMTSLIPEVVIPAKLLIFIRAIGSQSHSFTCVGDDHQLMWHSADVKEFQGILVFMLAI